VSEDAALAARAEKLSSRMRELGLDALLVQSLVDVRYLSGFTGSSAALVILTGGPPHRFLTDFRYETQSSEQVPDELFEREIVTGELLDALAQDLGGRSGRVGFFESSTTVKALRQLDSLLAERWELVPCEEEVARLRAVKDAGEILRIRAAAELADEALAGVLEDGLAGRTEREVALELELRMRRLGAEGGSFPAIVASGPRGSLPHAKPQDVEIPADVLVTIDWGALHEGYCSDCTRTYATGEHISARAREIYGLVLEAQLAGLHAVRPGIGGREADAAAREVIERAGEGERFGHGLGHGVGLEIHEPPRLSRTAPEEPLRAGNVVTVEPGVYLPGELGVRIEDLVVLGEDAQEVLTRLPKVLTVIS
jgi:Xaa-Pro aminopeptidase